MVDHETPTDERTELLAGELHERARTLNHLTQGTPGLTRPEAACTIAGNLAQTAFRLAKTAEQLDAFLHRELDAGRLVHERGDGLLPTALKAHDALAAACEQSMNLGESFRGVQGALAAIRGIDADSETPQRAQGETELRVEEQTDQATASDIQPAARDFPRSIGDVLSGPPAAPSSPSHRPSSKPPSPRREM
ncbi:hypothetical protein F8568_022405 [Actinomadura sp. LD22]|uniref:Uncharacterized protein n=1 Tax=Actinomadura physcomitrii TaxID=2650748 RepID=A0A6I4M9G2_9ACTN|nr:hypothetical protein [Actinomadura physcomitrii]MWA02352.1 hypothetical protein [Actinomadura physcomitrii]MWA03076.1 hypothetical protein [Actinomadura physcomitrii]